jgi:hypothetical protein
MEGVGIGRGKGVVSLGARRRGRLTGQTRWEPYGNHQPVTSSRQNSESAGVAKQTSAAVRGEPPGVRRARPAGQTGRAPGDGELADVFPRTVPFLAGVAVPSTALTASEPLHIPEPDLATLAASMRFSPPMESIEALKTPPVRPQDQSTDFSFLDPNRPLEPWEQDIFGGDVDYDEFFGVALG